MKQVILFLSLIGISLSACKKQEFSVSITGHIVGLNNDTIYLYGADEFADFILPVAVQDERFNIQLNVDTLSMAMLFLQDGNEFPVFLEKGSHVSISADMAVPGKFKVEGGHANNQLHIFNRSLEEVEQLNDSIARNMAEAYILSNHSSVINLYLLDKYFVRNQSLDYPRIKRVIDILDGTLKDRLYVEELQALLQDEEKAEVGKYAPSFNLYDTDNKRVSRTDFKDNYLLITFWASWDEQSKAANDSLKRIAKRYKVKKYAKEEDTKKTTAQSTATKKVIEEGLAMLSISLDPNKEEWKTAIERDTLKWNHVYDPKSWTSSVVKQFAVHEIPYHILLDSKGKIVARGLTGDALNATLEELIKKKKQ